MIKHSILGILSLGMLFGAGCSATVSPSSDVIDQQAAKADLIQVDNLPNGSKVQSPIALTGKARGTWFAEGGFPVAVYDADGNVLAQHYALTEEEWMTEEFVSWTSTVEFEPSKTQTGTVEFSKGNLSGEPQFDDSLTIPVAF